MTKDQIREELKLKLSDYLDGFIVIGRIAGRPEFVVAHHILDPQTQGGITVAMATALHSLSQQEIPPKKSP